MKLWYTRPEMREAQKEAEEIILRYNRDMRQYFRGDVEIRMAWRVETRSREVVPLEEWRMYGEDSLPTYIPEAELLFSGEVMRRDLLDLLCLDILHLEMKLMIPALANAE